MGEAGRGSYERRRPELTLLHQLVAEHLESFLAEARADGRPGLPRYVESELREYLECGILAHGFARAVCSTCGEEMVVAFSCKRRGLCPSCNARRMCSTAAHLVDHVFPDVPVRQWVLSVPWELRLLLARHAGAFGALIRIFAAEVLAWQERVAREEDIVGAKGGGVTFQQRFGGSLNLITHVHGVFPDGVFLHDSTAGPARFVPLRAPTSVELSLVCERVSERFMRWLIRRGLVQGFESAEHDACPSPGSEGSGSAPALEACVRAALAPGELGTVRAHLRGASVGRAHDEPLRPRRSKGKHVGEAAGFGIHAGVAVAGANRLGRELLFRYCARPPFSLERLTRLPDGRFAYELRHAWRRDQTHRIMTPLELLARIAALVPPPRHPLIRFHGVFAPNSSWRKRVVPGVTPIEGAGQDACSCDSCHDPASARMTPTDRASAAGAMAGATQAVAANSSFSTVSPVTHQSTAPSHVSDCVQSDPNAACTPAREPGRRKSWWIDWATLLRRVHDIDALACKCGGRLRFVEVVTDRDAALAHLDRLGLAEPAPPIARARSPASDFIDPPSPDP